MASASKMQLADKFRPLDILGCCLAANCGLALIVPVFEKCDEPTPMSAQGIQESETDSVVPIPTTVAAVQETANEYV